MTRDVYNPHPDLSPPKVSLSGGRIDPSSDVSGSLHSVVLFLVVGPRFPLHEFGVPTRHEVLGSSPVYSCPSFSQTTGVGGVWGSTERKGTTET